MGATCFLASFLKPFVQVLVTAGADTGLAFGITAAFTFLFLFGLYDLCQVVAVLLAQDAADLSVLIEVTGAAAIRTVCMVSDTIDHFCLTHSDILLEVLHLREVLK